MLCDKLDDFCYIFYSYLGNKYAGQVPKAPLKTPKFIQMIHAFIRHCQHRTRHDHGCFSVCCEELPGWLLPFNTGTVGRAISTVPLTHDFEQDTEALVAQIEARYAAHGFKAAFRLPDGVSFEPLKQHLTQFGANGLRPRL